MFSRGFYFLLCSLIVQFDAVAVQGSSVVDEFVFAREGAAKGNGGLNRIYERRVD